MRERFLPFARADFGDAERAAVLEVLDSGWLTTGPRVQELEAGLSELLGGRETVCMSSGTAALHTALTLLDLAPGDEVVTSPLTFVSAVHAILHAGGTPVFADVEEDTLNLDPASVARVLTGRTRAILPVHYGGHPADMDGLGRLAADRNLVVIEDAAHALGAAYRGRPAGTLGDMGCFSFYVTKNITTGEGGALVTDDPARADRARLLSLHGMDRDAWKRYTEAGSWFYEVVAPGFKYNMTDLAAALGICQLRRLEAFNRRRRELCALYDARLGDCPAVRLPAVRDDVESAYHLYPVRLDLDRLTIDRARFMEALKAENIGASVHFVPVPMHPFYRDRFGFTPGMFPVTEAAYAGLVSLPLYPAMDDADVEDAAAAVLKIAAHCGR